MRLFLEYLKQRLPLYGIGAVFCLVFAFCFRLYHLPLTAVFYPALLCAVLALVLSLVDFLSIKRRQDALKRIRSMTDAIANTLPRPLGAVEAEYQDIIRLLTEEHNAYRTDAGRKYADMVDYYTVWAHQIKTPIASMRLNLQNEDSPQSRKLYGDLRRIEQYAEMVLTFLRLDTGSTDYVFREYDLDPIIRQAAKKFSHDFIGRKLSLQYEPVNAKVFTDEKWLSFVIEQVLSNALKYTHEGGVSIALDEEMKLTIRDTGIGVAPEDLPRIFENGFTGYNGRADKKASGIGLYLCQRICTNLGHPISAASALDEGTAITIDLAREKLWPE